MSKITAYFIVFDKSNMHSKFKIIFLTYVRDQEIEMLFTSVTNDFVVLAHLR